MPSLPSRIKRRTSLLLLASEGRKSVEVVQRGERKKTDATSSKLSASTSASKKNASVSGLVTSAQMDLVRFAEADADGSNSLNWEEFLAMQPAPVREKHSDDVIRGWFEAVDMDGNGEISLDEFFLWMLMKNTSNNMQAVREMFSQYDKDCSGMVDAAEFQQITEDMGCGALAHQLFKDLDVDGSGYVDYSDLLARVTQFTGSSLDGELGPAQEADTAASFSPATKQFLLAQMTGAYKDLERDNRYSLRRLDNSLQSMGGVTLDATDPKELVSQLQMWIKSSKLSTAEVMEVRDRFMHTHTWHARPRT